jgi:hypothetical protein
MSVFYFLSFPEQQNYEYGIEYVDLCLLGCDDAWSKDQKKQVASVTEERMPIAEKTTA